MRVRHLDIAGLEEEEAPTRMMKRRARINPFQGPAYGLWALGEYF